MSDELGERPRGVTGGTLQAEKVYDDWLARFPRIIKEGEDPADKKPLDELEAAPENLSDADKHVWRRHYEDVQDLMTRHLLNIVDLKEFAKEDALRRTELEIKGETDSLTGLRNRNGLRRILEDLAQQHKKTPDQSSAVFLRADANGLKHINDTYGHKAGDEYLRTFGETFKEVFGGNIASRDGGDEFGILLLDTSLDEATTFWEDFNSKLPDGFSIVGGATRLNFGDVEGSMHTADKIMYEAKRRSKEEGQENCFLTENQYTPIVQEAA